MGNFIRILYNIPRGDVVLIEEVTPYNFFGFLGKLGGIIAILYTALKIIWFPCRYGWDVDPKKAAVAAAIARAKARKAQQEAQTESVEETPSEEPEVDPKKAAVAAAIARAKARKAQQEANKNNTEENE